MSGKAQCRGALRARCCPLSRRAVSTLWPALAAIRGHAGVASTVVPVCVALWCPSARAGGDYTVSRAPLSPRPAAYSDVHGARAQGHGAAVPGAFVVVERAVVYAG